MGWLENRRVRREWQRKVERIFSGTDEPRNKTMKASHFICVTTLAVALSACAPNAEKSPVGAEEQGVAQGRTLIVDGKAREIPEGADVISWKCREYGSRDSKDEVLVEVGRASFASLVKTRDEYQELDESDKDSLSKILKALEDHTAFVLYDGTNEGELAFYSREGLDQNWYWGSLGEEDQKYRYAIVIKPDGKGLYYDFSTAKDGVKNRADDVFKCSR
ncbi:hypothetical protein EYC98_15370 [Halieaceae bacterium IMCC14734]|uniref:Lipoprotein n=1 Tax=Candidatus Litorirhabdus singularis TaxID=2518993 RepID=A0ABT3TIT6_9GAMM|nr:hypothetical protein [Candidatus Litorirhabdus singularis]MCX2982241.1 hypothetical protein [Candidatus Litorirhabdus singularis]